MQAVVTSVITVPVTISWAISYPKDRNHEVTSPREAWKGCLINGAEHGYSLPGFSRPLLQGRHRQRPPSSTWYGAVSEGWGFEMKQLRVAVLEAPAHPRD